MQYECSVKKTFCVSVYVEVIVSSITFFIHTDGLVAFSV